MIIQGRCFCDLCAEYLGQIWGLPAPQPDLLSDPDFHVCDDCFIASEPLDVLGDRPQISQ